MHISCASRIFCLTSIGGIAKTPGRQSHDLVGPAHCRESANNVGARARFVVVSTPSGLMLMLCSQTHAGSAWNYKEKAGRGKRALTANMVISPRTVVAEGTGVAAAAVAGTARLLAACRGTDCDLIIVRRHWFI